MANKRVSYHDLFWDHPSRRGALRLSFDDRSKHVLGGLSPEELSVLCELLRSGKAVYYDPSNDTLSTDADFVPPAE